MFPTFNEAMQGIASGLSDLDRKRLSYVASLKKHGTVLAIAVAIIVACAILIDALVLFAIIGLVIYIIIAAILLTRKYKALRLAFKQTVVAGLMNELLRLCQLPGETEAYRYESHFSPKQRVDDLLIEESRLFNYSIDKIRGEDLFYGRLGLTDFKFSELTLIQVRTSTNSKGHTTRTEHTMFDGILFVADFHKEFEGVTILKTAHMFNSGVLGGFFAPIRQAFGLFAKERKRSIDLENEDFNRAFHVQTTDDIKARYILTSSMMERLLQFRNKHHDKVEVSFVHSKMYIALSSKKDYFEPKALQPIAPEQARAVYDDLIFLFSLVEEFDLNTRIWSKV